MSQFTIPGGREKGKPIEEASPEALAYWINRLDNDLADNPEKPYADRDQALLEAMRVVQSGGKGDGGARPAQQRQRPAAQAPNRSAIQSYQGAHTDAKAATEALARLQEIGHLISPAPAVGQLPEGTAIVVSAIMIDADRETYSTAGTERGLGKVALNKLAGAVGISWDGVSSSRLDDGSDPHFVHFRAVGHLRDFSGQITTIKGEKIMDLRDGSPTVKALQDRAEAKARRSGNEKPADWQSQLRDMRMFILEHAETKAQLRAIRSLPGVRTSFTAEELRKPFFGARLQFTGHTDDPELRRMFAEKIADSFLGAQASLYGPRSFAATVPRGAAPPPVGRDYDRRRPIETEGQGVDDEPRHDADGVVDDDFPEGY